MAQRGIQLIRTDDTIPGRVRFYDRRQTDVKLAFIAEVDVMEIPDANEITWSDLVLAQETAGETPPAMDHPLIRAAVHGVTQNILDASNKLDGNERRDYIKRMCAHVQTGGWASAPVDEAAATKRVEEALAKLPAEVRAALIAKMAPKPADPKPDAE